MKIICRRFYIDTPFTFRDMRTWDIWKVCLQTFGNNRICSKLAYFLRNFQTSPANNSRILRIKIAKFSEYCFYTNTNIQWEFQICISVLLTPLYHFNPLQGHLNICRAITAESSPLHIASSRTRTGNLWFWSASCWPLSYVPFLGVPGAWYVNSFAFSVLICFMSF